MSDYTVRLEEVFQGPMDLLLHLVREQEVEIHEVRIHAVIDGFFDYLERLDALDIESAADFLVMASTLMAIKSRSLLPRDEVDLDEGLDPEDELIQRLMEYRHFKGAADELEDRWRVRRARHSRGNRSELRDLQPERTLDLGELSAWDLLATFSRLLRETRANRPLHVRGEARPLRWYVHELGRAIRSAGSLPLGELIRRIEPEPTREGWIGTFCAVLELMRLGVVTARQEAGGEIRVEATGDLGEDLERVIDASRFLDEAEPEGGNAPRGGPAAGDGPYSAPMPGEGDPAPAPPPRREEEAPES